MSVPANVVKAIGKARKPGGCKYVDRDKPCCVIAQLYILEGGNLEELKKFDTENGILYDYISTTNDVRRRLFKHGDSELGELQYTWDNYVHKDKLSNHRKNLLERAKEIWS